MRRGHPRRRLALLVPSTQRAWASAWPASKFRRPRLQHTLSAARRLWRAPCLWASARARQATARAEALETETAARRRVHLCRRQLRLEFRPLSGRAAQIRSSSPHGIRAEDMAAEATEATAVAEAAEEAAVQEEAECLPAPVDGSP